MTNYTSNTYKLKRDILNFSKKISKSLLVLCQEKVQVKSEFFTHISVSFN